MAHQSATELRGFGLAQQVVAWLTSAPLDPVCCGVVQYSSAWLDRVSHWLSRMLSGSISCDMAPRDEARPRAWCGSGG